MILCDPAVSSLEATHDAIRRSFAAFASAIRKRRYFRAGYLSELVREYRFHIEPQSRVLEIGVGTGDLLALLGSARVGIDICPEMLSVAKASHPELELYVESAEDPGSVAGQFDYIILSDLTVHLYDVVKVLQNLQRFCHNRTRIIFNFHSKLWQPILYVLAALGLSHKHHRTNWITTEDLENLLRLADFEVLKTQRSVLLPVYVPFISALLNRYVSRLPFVQHLCLVNWVIARPVRKVAATDELTVSVICPCRNEAGTIERIVQRLPRLGRCTELIFIEGGSRDNTWAAIQNELASPRRPDLLLKAYQQPGKGKADAVHLGFAKATGDVLMILDGDLSVAPEDLPLFLEVFANGKGEFINGSRLVYPMEGQAMRFLNMAANKFFALTFSYLLDQPIKDTLCGTKALSRRDYERIATGHDPLGASDPFGDFELLFGAARLNLRIVEVPIRYRDRVYGATNISRFRNGWTLLRMSVLGLRRFKFR